MSEITAPAQPPDLAAERASDMSVRGQLRRQSAINVTGALIKIAAAVVSTTLTVRFAGLDEFGRWSFLLSVATFIATADFGLPTTVTVYLSHSLGGGPSDRMSARVSYVAVSAVVVALAMGATAGGLVLLGPQIGATQEFFARGPANLILAGSIAVFVASRILANVAAAFLQASANYRAYVSIGLTFVLPTALGMPLAALWGYDATAFMHVHATFSTVSFLVYLHAVLRMRKMYGWRFARIGSEWLAMARFGVGSWLASTGGLLFSQLDRVVVGILLGTRELGIYGAATLVASQINALSALVIQPLLTYVPRFAHDMRAHIGELRALLTDAIRVNTAVALALSGLLLIGAPAVAGILVEPTDAPPVILTLKILAVVYGVFSLNAVGFYCMFATHDLRRLCAISIGGGLVTLGTIAMGAHVAGLIGAVIGNGTFVATLAMTILALRRFGMSIRVWLRLIRVPATAWAVVVAIAAVDIRNPVSVALIAALFTILMFMWALRPLAGSPARAIIGSASLPK